MTPQTPGVQTPGVRCPSRRAAGAAATRSFPTGDGVGFTRRRALSAGAVGTAGAVLAACGSGRDTATTTPAQQPATIVWMTDWTGGARGEASKLSIPAFQEQYPTIKLDMQATDGNSFEALSAHLAAGTLGDVVFINSTFFELFAERGVFMDVGPLLQKYRFNRDSVWWESQYFEHKGKTHGLPYQFGIGTWVYNKDWFQRDGVPPPTDAWTTDDLLAAGQKLVHRADNKWGADLKVEPNSTWIWFWANGVDLTEGRPPQIKSVLDQPKQLEVLQYCVDMINRYQVAPSLYGQKAVKGLSFANGDFAVSTSTAPKSLVSTIGAKFDWDIMPVPRWAGTKKRVTFWNHQAHMITKAGEQRGHGEAATQFAIWMCGEGGMTFVAKTGGSTPVNKKIALSPVYLEGKPANLKTQLDMLDRKANQDVRGWKLWPSEVPWEAAVKAVLQQGFAGEISVREMATQATRAGDAALIAAGDLKR